MRLEFTKMHGCGNDYIYVDCNKYNILDPANDAIILSDRHTGIGADGLVLICPSEAADAKMRMFNADGSEGKMCGNAIRCVAKYLYEKKKCEKEELNIETLSGIKKLRLFVNDGKVDSVLVDMGIASFEPKDIPMDTEEKMISAPVICGNTGYTITAVSMGNPHAVCFRDNVADMTLSDDGPKIGACSIFSEGVNVEFVRVIDCKTLEMRVWERGSGETLACGTGACASVAAAVANGICPRNTDVTVRLRGGDLNITCDGEYHIFMKGAAEFSFEGVVDNDKIK